MAFYHAISTRAISWMVHQLLSIKCFSGGLKVYDSVRLHVTSGADSDGLCAGRPPIDLFIMFRALYASSWNSVRVKLLPVEYTGMPNPPKVISRNVLGYLKHDLIVPSRNFISSFKTDSNRPHAVPALNQVTAVAALCKIQEERSVPVTRSRFRTGSNALALSFKSLCVLILF